MKLCRWLYKIFRLRYERDLESSDLYNCLKQYSSQTLGNLISKIWNQEQEKCKEENLRKPSLLRVLLRCFGKELIVMGLLQGFNEIFIRYVKPQFKKEFVKTSDKS